MLLGAKGSAAEFVTDEQLQEAARAQREPERVKQIMRSGKEEIPRSRLSVEKHWIEDTTTGERYRPFGGIQRIHPTSACSSSARTGCR